MTSEERAASIPIPDPHSAAYASFIPPAPTTRAKVVQPQFGYPDPTKHVWQGPKASSANFLRKPGSINDGNAQQIEGVYLSGPQYGTQAQVGGVDSDQVAYGAGNTFNSIGEELTYACVEFGDQIGSNYSVFYAYNWCNSGPNSGFLNGTLTGTNGFTNASFFSLHGNPYSVLEQNVNGALSLLMWAVVYDTRFHEWRGFWQDALGYTIPNPQSTRNTPFRAAYEYDYYVQNAPCYGISFPKTTVQYFFDSSGNQSAPIYGGTVTYGTCFSPPTPWISVNLGTDGFSSTFYP